MTTLLSAALRREEGDIRQAIRASPVVMSPLTLKETGPRSPLVCRMNDVLSRVVPRVPVGTDLGLLHLVWMLEAEHKGCAQATAPSAHCPAS